MRLNYLSVCLSIYLPIAVRQSSGLTERDRERERVVVVSGLVEANESSGKRKHTNRMGDQANSVITCMYVAAGARRYRIETEAAARLGKRDERRRSEIGVANERLAHTFR